MSKSALIQRHKTYRRAKLALLVREHLTVTEPGNFPAAGNSTPTPLRRRAPISKRVLASCPCPGCGQQNAKKVWLDVLGGGVCVGPKLLSHVKANSRVGVAFCNGKTGHSTFNRPCDYRGVSLVLG